MWWSAVQTEARNFYAGRVLPGMLDEKLAHSVLDRCKRGTHMLVLSENLSVL